MSFILQNGNWIFWFYGVCLNCFFRMTFYQNNSSIINDFKNKKTSDVEYISQNNQPGNNFNNCFALLNLYGAKTNDIHIRLLNFSSKKGMA